MSPFRYLAALAVLVLSATLQGLVGFGGNLVASPLLLLIAPELVPGPLIAANVVLTASMARGETVAGVWDEVRWPLAGTVPGTIAGAAVLVVASTRNLTVVLSVIILVAVGLSLLRVPLRRNPRTLAVSGTLSGFMGTIAGIGGPPVALLYQHATGREIRASISRFFLVSSLLSVAVLAVFGRFDLTSLARGALLAPAPAVGYLLSSRVRDHVRRRHVRVAVLGLSTASAVVALARSLT
jgi:uncharacterized membrane protein YfcA